MNNVSSHKKNNKTKHMNEQTNDKPEIIIAIQGWLGDLGKLAKTHTIMTFFVFCLTDLKSTPGLVLLWLTAYGRYDLCMKIHFPHLSVERCASY